MPTDPDLRLSKEYLAMKGSAIPRGVEGGLLRKPLDEPLLVYTLRPHKSARARQSHCILSLEIIGMSGSFCEALLVRTALVILGESGQRHVGLEINSLGDRDTTVRYLRDCSSYYHKYTHALHPTCQEVVRQNPLVALVCSHESCTELREGAPKPIAYLNESDRRHFREVLEYLEMLKVPYQINETLVPTREPYGKTIFEMRPTLGIVEAPMFFDRRNTLPLVHGGRYDDFARKIGSRMDIPAVGASLLLAAPLPTVRLSRPAPKPRAYFIQIGPEARRRSLIVLEILRRAHIPVCQSVGLDKLGGQLTLAESLGLPYTIIMGHKEAVEESVIVRHTDTRSQETVPLAELARYAKLIR